MTERKAGTGQLKKLAFTKHISDKYGVVWKLSTYKVLLWMILSIIILVALYSFFSEDQTSFLKMVLFYGIVIMIVSAVIWIASNFIWKARKLFVGFILAWILILGVYIVFGFALSFLGWMEFHYGFSTYLTITSLAILGSSRLDNNLDKRDVFFGCLVLIIIFVGNFPIFENGGFFATLDGVIDFITSKIPLISGFFSSISNVATNTTPS